MRIGSFVLWLGAIHPQDDPVEPRRLVDQLRSEAIEEREQAARRLIDLGARAVPELEKAQKGQDPEVAGRARELLRVISISQSLSETLKASLPGIAHRLAHPESSAWVEAFMKAARGISYSSLSPERRSDLTFLAPRAMQAATDGFVRRRICMYSAQWELTGAVPLLIDALADAETQVRAQAAEALGDLQAADAVPALTVLLRDGESAVRLRAVRALREIGDERAAPSARALLGDSDARVRAEAALALAWLGDREVGPDLAQALRVNNPGVRDRVPDALARVDPAGVAPALLDLLTADDAEVRAKAVLALGKIGAKEAAAQVTRCLEDPSPEVRAGALEALAGLDAPGSLETIRKLVGDEDPRVRVGALTALGRFEGRGAQATYLKLMRDPDRDVWETAAELLCECGFLPAGRKLLVESFRCNALNALRRPELWRELRGKTVPSLPRGTPRQIMSELARKAGLEADFAAVASPEGKGRLDWPQRPFRLPDDRRLRYETSPQTLLEAFGNALSADFFFILEPGRAIILDWKEADRFWRDWLDRQDKK